MEFSLSINFLPILSRINGRVISVIISRLIDVLIGRLITMLDW